MDRHDIGLAVRRFIGENFLFRDDGDAITHDASLLDAGIIDSTGVLELVCFLETNFGIEGSDDEMLPENLDSIHAISNYVARKLESRKVEVVFHDADYDLRLLQQDYGWHVRTIFDTMIAAQLLGYTAFGLAALLERFFDVKLDKKHQRADWSMRPLTRDMLDYAAQDTRYLLQLRDHMAAELERVR